MAGNRALTGSTVPSPGSSESISCTSHLAVVHVTAVHVWWDNRIFKKMVRSLVKEGVDVHLVAKKLGRTPPEDDGVKFHWLPEKRGFLGRILRSLYIVRICVRLKNAIVHFHDPELIPAGLFLKMMGRAVIYDVHEDYLLAIDHKKYLPAFIKPIIRALVWVAESIAARAFFLVLAERVYAKRFPSGTQVLNYPIIDTTVPFPRKISNDSGLRLLYTGSITEERGVFIYLRLLELMPTARLSLVGRCSDKLRLQLEESTSRFADRFELVASPEGIPFESIRNIYLRRKWTCGLAVFPFSKHYIDKELTKIFEYMAYGIPVLCSNFPAWVELVEGIGAGISVSPENFQEMVRGIQNLDETGVDEGVAERVRRDYSWESQYLVLSDLYRTIYRARSL